MEWLCAGEWNKDMHDNSSVAWYGSWLLDSLEGHSMQYGSEPVEVGSPQPVSTACSLST
jgi:hypothetical protein